MPEGPSGPTLWQVALSVLAAAFGVQSSKNRERDFRHGKPSQFIIIGLIFIMVFVLSILGLVTLVLPVSGV